MENQVTLTVSKELGYVTVEDIKRATQELPFETGEAFDVPGGYTFRWTCLAEVYDGEKRIHKHRLANVSDSPVPIVGMFYNTLSLYDGEATHYILSECVRES